MAETRTAVPVDPLPGPAIPADQGSASVGQGATRVGSGTSSDASIGDLISKATSDLSTLMRQEVELAKLELKAEVQKAGKGAGLLGGAGGAGYFGLLFLSIAFMFLLGAIMPLGWAAFIVGAIYTAIALVLFLKGRKELKTIDPTPHQTVETLKEDVQWARHPSR